MLQVVDSRLHGIAGLRPGQAFALIEKEIADRVREGVMASLQEGELKDVILEATGRQNIAKIVNAHIQESINEEVAYMVAKAARKAAKRAVDKLNGAEIKIIWPE